MKILCETIANPNNIISKGTPFSIIGGKVLVNNNSSLPGGEIVVGNSIAFPGLINIHDHLKYSWYRRIGRGKMIEKNQPRYNNVYKWLEDLYKNFDCVFDKTNDGLDIMFQLGLYKQIFSATTTVVNHSRYSKNILSPQKQYISIVENIESEFVVQPELISNVTSHPLFFGKGIQDAHNKAINSIPQKAFMIHAAEGTDEVTKTEINILEKLGVLTPQTILVHCINTDEKDIELIANKKCTIVWCPYTNNYIIGKIADIKNIISKGINVCIGTDSSCSGSKNLLEELNYAKKQFNTRFHTEISSSDLFNMVTCNPAKALMLENKIGKISDGYSADIAIIDKKSEYPYDDILSCAPEDIIALWSRGVFIYGDEWFFHKVSKQADSVYSVFTTNGRKKVIIGNPRSLLNSFVNTFNEGEPVSFNFLPRELQLSLNLCGIM